MSRERQFVVRPDPDDGRLTRLLDGVDQDGAVIEARVVEERPLTLFLNGQEIVTVMTIRDYPQYLALGYLLNQNMLRHDDEVTGIDYDEDIETVVVRTKRETDFEETLRKKTLTSGCAQGTVFGDLMERFEATALDPEARLKTSWLYALSRAINMQPSLYLVAGAIHGCVLCEERRSHSSTWRMSAGTTPSTRSRATCSRTSIGAAGKIMYTTGSAHQRDGHQDRDDGHPRSLFRARASPPGWSSLPARPISR